MRVRHHPLVSFVAVSGGPSAGKSSFLSYAKAGLEDRGFRVGIQPEVATELINGGFVPWAGWRNPLDFQSRLLEYMIFREDLYARMLAEQDIDKPLVLICDRGTLDAIAYIGKAEFVRVAESVGYTLEALRSRYNMVIHLESASVRAAAHYTLENNAARTEKDTEAAALDERTRQAWEGHQHHVVIEGRDDFNAKLTAAFNSMGRVLDMPTAKEKERKFIFTNFSTGLLEPYKPVAVEIVQIYLTSGPKGQERRVRRRTLDGESSFFYTEKVETGEKGVREEKERLIPRSEYERLILEADRTAQMIKKTRYNVFFENRKFEVDVFQKPKTEKVFVEVEVGDMQELFDLPPGWNLIEVTGDKRYSNHAIAHGSLSE
jgi:CYTH domain-containing protein/thymidylate kinase